MKPDAEHAGDVEDFPGGMTRGDGAADEGAQEELIRARLVPAARMAVVEADGGVSGLGERQQANPEFCQLHLLAAGNGGHVEREVPAIPKLGAA